MSSLNDIIQTIWNCSYSNLLDYQRKAFRLRIDNFGNTLWVYSPSMIRYGIDQYNAQNQNKYAAISITGKSCELNCEHCKATLLNSMIPVQTSQELLKLGQELKKKGCEYLLISGGSNKNGSVPVLEFVDAIKQLHAQLHFKIFLHTGLLYEDMVKSISTIPVESVMFDFIADNKTISNIYHLNKNTDDYIQALHLLKKYNIPFAPHIILGLNYGEITSELEAIRIIAESEPNCFVIVILKPIEGTPMQDIPSIPIEIITRFFVISRITLPNIPISLGCARPIGDDRIAADIQAVESGLNAVAFLSQDGADHAEKKGLKLKFSDSCCSDVYKRVHFI